MSVYRTIGPLVLLDPLKPHFYYISTGLKGSYSHGDISMMGNKNGWIFLHNFFIIPCILIEREQKWLDFST